MFLLLIWFTLDDVARDTDRLAHSQTHNRYSPHTPVSGNYSHYKPLRIIDRTRFLLGNVQSGKV